MSVKRVKKLDKLTPADVKFVKLVLQQDQTNAQCYLEAFPKHAQRTPDTNRVEMCKYMKLPKIVAEFERQIAVLRKESIMNLQEKLEFLKEIVQNPADKTGDKIKAIELSAKLQHMFKERVEHSGAITQNHNITPELAQAIDKLFE